VLNAVVLSPEFLDITQSKSSGARFPYFTGLASAGFAATMEK
jgi:hypothetical protein